MNEAIKPKIIQDFEISKDTLEHLDPLEKKVAEILIKKGKWKLKI
jgi:hypothetical protein